MDLRLDRNWLLGETTLGRLYIDGKFFCYTLEDKVRNKKIHGETAIPFGKYEVDLTYSPHFKKQMPLIKNVPNFSGIRIHTGSKKSHTDGCLLIGKKLSGDNKLEQSREAFNEFYALVKQAKSKGEKIEINIVAPDKKPIIIAGFISLALLLVGGIILHQAIKKKIYY